MSADEIVKALRICNQPRGHRCSECPVLGRYEHGICKATIDSLAADLIESLQAQLAAKDAEIARLTTERTAMLKTLQKSDIDCDSCKHNGVGNCEDADFDCNSCVQDCRCKLCDGNSKWEWRGAGEG